MKSNRMNDSLGDLYLKKLYCTYLLLLKLDMGVAALI